MFVTQSSMLVTELKLQMQMQDLQYLDRLTQGVVTDNKNHHFLFYKATNYKMNVEALQDRMLSCAVRKSA